MRTTGLDQYSSLLSNLLISRLTSQKLFSTLSPECPLKILINHASPFFKTLSQFPIALGSGYSWYSKFFTPWSLISSAALPTSPDHSTPLTCQPTCTHRYIPPQPAHPQSFSHSDLLSVLQVHYGLLLIPKLCTLFLPPKMPLPLPSHPLLPSSMYLYNLFSSFQDSCWFSLISSRKLCLNTPTQA